MERREDARLSIRVVTTDPASNMLGFKHTETALLHSLLKELVDCLIK